MRRDIRGSRCGCRKGKAVGIDLGKFRDAGSNGRDGLFELKSSCVICFIILWLAKDLLIVLQA